MKGGAMKGGAITIRSYDHDYEHGTVIVTPNRNRNRPALSPRCGSPDEAYALCRARRDGGFTLLEVMIAMAVFFIVAFAVLGVVMQSLGAAKALQTRHADAGMLAAELSLTNMLEEGYESGDFGDIFPGQRWERQIAEVGSNGLFQVDFVVFERTAKGREVAESMSIIMHRPGSPGAGMRRVR